MNEKPFASMTEGNRINKPLNMSMQIRFSREPNVQQRCKECNICITARGNRAGTGPLYNRPKLYSIKIIY
jgi:hypothetical protein